jgi:hypothetical protein
MTPIPAIRDLLQRDDGLPALLDTGYAAFELLLVAIEEHEDPASGMFAPFVFAATHAANGRDAILSAPSLPPRPLHRADADVGGRGSGTGVLEIVALSQLLCHVLAQAADSVPSHDDQAACLHAARSAAAIHRLLTGTDP